MPNKELTIKNKKKLNDIKLKINNNILGYKDQVAAIMLYLAQIENEKLFYYDHCRSMREFINKNDYPKRMEISYSTIVRHLGVGRYITENKLPDSVKKINICKLDLLRQYNVVEPQRVIELGNYSLNALKAKFHDIRSPASGQFVKKGTTYDPKKNLKIIEFEIPRGKIKTFERDLIRICNRHNIKIL